jgi:hypothetical protein
MCVTYKSFHDQHHHRHSNQEQEVPHFPQQTKGPKQLFAIWQARRPGKISASHASKGVEISTSPASKGATIAAIGPPSNRALQLNAGIPSLGIPKHSAHMVSYKIFLRADLEEPFNVGKNLTRSQDAGLHKIIKLIRDFGLLLTHSCIP